MPRLLDVDPPLPTPFTIAQAIAAGLTVDQVRYRVRSGRWESLGRGEFRRAGWAASDLDDFARARLDHVHRAVLAARRNPGSVVGFESAALVHGLPFFSPVPRTVTLIVGAGHWTGTRHGVRMRRAVLSDTQLEGRSVHVTTAGRTWLDVARTLPLSDALAVGDAGLRRGIFARDALVGLVEESEVKRGCRRAALAAAHVSALRETVLESASWAYFVEQAVPLPRMQVEVRNHRGAFVARVDFLWDEGRLVGESDGRMKYTTPGDLYSEKRREDELRAEGFTVVRWSWSDLFDGRLADRLRILL
jgi:very-short-patch-repair endonuclease